MRYLIDGYNLLHAVEVQRNFAGPHGLEAARHRLLDRLRRALGADAVHVTIVFDASRAPPRASTHQDYHGIIVQFAVHEQADDRIEELIRHDPAPKQLTVVSSDRRLQEAARRRDCRVLDCLTYLERLDHPERPPPTATADSPAKPEGLSAEETQHWLEEFGGLEKEPGLRDWFEMNPPLKDEG